MIADSQLDFMIKNNYNCLFEGHAGVGKCLTGNTLTKVKVSDEVYRILLERGQIHGESKGDSKV